MNYNNKTVFLDNYELIVQYASNSYERKGRVSVNENLADGEPVFHTGGLSQVVKVDLDILIPVDSGLYDHLDSKVYKNEKVEIKSNFGKIFPSGKYYIESFKPKYLDAKYYECTLPLIYFNGVEVTELYSYSRVSTNETILSDKTSVVNKTKSKEIKEGHTDSEVVKKIQKTLRRNGFYLMDEGSALIVDGIYGQYTTKAVQQFQKTKGIKVTGTVNEETAKLLNI